MALMRCDHIESMPVSRPSQVAARPFRRKDRPRLARLPQFCRSGETGLVRRGWKDR